MRKVLATLLGLMILIVGVAGAAPIDPKIDAICKKYFKDPNGPGAAVAVIIHGKIVHKQCYGMANIKTREAITPATRFDLASVSKQFTASCILLLSKSGRVRLNDDIRKYFPQLPAYSAKRAIRIDDLLSMRSGLPEYDDADAAMSRKKFLAWLATQKLDQATGTKYDYINTNYALLGFIVETASGKTMRDFLQHNIFGPLHMTRTLYFQDAASAPPQRAMGYAIKKGKTRESRDDVPGFADGNIFSCLDDMIVWEAALRAHTLLGATLQKLAWTRAVLDNGKAYEYGMGWEISKPSSQDSYVEHGGAWYGASAYISLDFTDGESIIVLSNLEDAAPELAGEIGSR